MSVLASQVCVEEREQIDQRQQEVLGVAGLPSLGVSLSGGGIRSATFHLGIIQGMAESGLLPRIDYLSTVSGGGYIGTWLHGVIQRFGGGDPRQVKELLTRPEDRPHQSPDSDPIAFLRKYSNYLSPELGLFSADFWVVAGIWLRNMTLNQMILLPFIAAVSLLTFVTGSFSGWYVLGHESNNGEIWLTLILLLIMVFVAGKGVGSVALAGTAPSGKQSPWDSAGTATVCALLVLLASLGMALSSHTLVDATWVQDKVPWIAGMVPAASQWMVGAVVIGLVLTGLFIVLQGQGRFIACFRARHNGRLPWFGSWGYPLLAGLPAGFAFFGVMKVIDRIDYWTAGPWNTIAWGPPFLAMAILAGASLHVGLMGVDYADNAREWLARVGAFVFLFSFAWAALFTISVFGPYWITSLAAVSWAAAGLGSGWILTSLVGALTGSSARTAGAPDAPPDKGFLGLITKVAPTVFMIGYLLIISLGLHIAIAQLCGIQGRAGIRAAAGAPTLVTATAARETELVEFADFSKECVVAVELLLAALAIVWYLPRRIDINEFSMNHFYKNRLVRCYLGATSGKARRPSRFTGFDPHDDMPLRDLLPARKYYGPFPLVNACLNLNRGSELAKKERKGSAFVFTPLYSGYDPPESETDNAAETPHGPQQLLVGGYRLTEGYGYPEGYAIGTTMAISGAAANPNGGYHTSRPMAFLMTLFNVRLGWWAGNTRKDGPSARPGPRHSLVTLLSELFAATDSRSNYINLSDGGHFENLGLYELVRRRCRYIIAGDAEQDETYAFESLGEAIRKCRTDFGAEIEIDPRRIRPKDGLSGTHCVVGKITYAAADGETERSNGWLLYLKSSLTGDEPQDVAQYKSSYPAFPQEPTSNQFFTESQFESYRKLGRHVWESAFENITPQAIEGGLEEIFTWLYRVWYPPTGVKDGVASRNAEAWSALLNKLADPVLGKLRPQLIAPGGKIDNVAEMPVFEGADATKIFLYTIEFIQLMENVWEDFRMFERANRESPANAGWIAVFRYWVKQPAFRAAWAEAGSSYNPLFRQFYDGLL